MTKSRAFNRFHRFTAKMRRRHLKSWLPQPCEGEPISETRSADLRKRCWHNDQLHELDNFHSDWQLG